MASSLMLPAAEKAQQAEPVCQCGILPDGRRRARERAHTAWRRGRYRRLARNPIRSATLLNREGIFSV